MIILSKLCDDELFLSLMEKVTLDLQMSELDEEYLLAVAITILKEYFLCNDERLFEFSYYLILKYSVRRNNYQPLLDFSTNFGLFQITNFIYKKQLVNDDAFSRFFIQKSLEKFSKNGVIETLKQHHCKKNTVNSDKCDNSFVAPTSYGKSSLILDICTTVPFKKMAIIVPTKSLLTQTYRMLVRGGIGNRKIIFHDEMYNDGDDFIAVFTQERALRLLKKNNVAFDVLVVDEAHNLFGCDSRVILLSRLIKKNKIRSPSSKTYYLSPLISDSTNLMFNSQQYIFEQKISHNIK